MAMTAALPCWWLCLDLGPHQTHGEQAGLGDRAADECHLTGGHDDLPVDVDLGAEDAEAGGGAFNRVARPPGGGATGGQRYGGGRKAHGRSVTVTEQRILRRAVGKNGKGCG